MSNSFGYFVETAGILFYFSERIIGRFSENSRIYAEFVVGFSKICSEIIKFRRQITRFSRFDFMKNIP